MAAKKTLNISAKLHPDHDTDLIEAINKIPRRDRSRTYREALRFYFQHHPISPDIGPGRRPH